MGLSEKYKEVLRSQGINANIESYKPKKDRTYLIIFIAAIIISVPSYFFVFQNYNSCSSAANYISTNTGQSNSSAVTNSFSFKCGTNSILYSVTIALIIAVILLLILKALKAKK